MNNMLSDKEVSKEGQDDFQRYPFAKRIAQTIINRDNPDGIVIGIYGAWGEGKTSVLNFISEELQTNEILEIKLNPWSYSNDNELLDNLLSKIAEKLGIKIEKITLSQLKIPPSKMLGENFHILPEKKVNKIYAWFQNKSSNFTQKYGKGVTIMGVKVDELGNAINPLKTIKERKEQVNEELIKAKKKLVIFIDDIDRLDKEEIYSLFKLIKLIADFKNTTYILSFDDKMVASAIGGRFGEGNQKAGYNFLEKIIQVPLKIPLAQPIALQKHCFKLLNNVLQENDVKFEDNLKEEFTEQFYNILPRLKTPRLSVRYANILAFSIPLLKGEVNLCDLMLIEALKIFYSGYYTFIKENPDYFINHKPSHSDYGTLVPLVQQEEGKQELKDYLDSLEKGLSQQEKRCVKKLLERLFPTLDTVFNEKIYTLDDKNKWDWEKRIVSSAYFARYFSYVVIEGQISDVSFNTFIGSIANWSNEDVITTLKGFITKNSFETFFHKINGIKQSLDSQTSKKLAFCLSSTGNQFSNRDEFFFGVGSEIVQVATFVIFLLKKDTKNDEVDFSLLEELITTPSIPITFSYELAITIPYTNPLFTKNQHQKLIGLLIKRVLKNADGVPLFEKYIDCPYLRYTNLWNAWRLYDKEDLKIYLTNIFDNNPNKIIDFLYSFSSIRTGEYSSLFNETVYKNVISFIDKEIIHHHIIEQFSSELEGKNEETEPNVGDLEQTKIDLLRLFESHYNKDKQREIK